MVVKIDSLEQREKLGVTSKAPRWVIAFKYPAEQVQTVLRSVDWQVGKGGTLTPSPGWIRCSSPARRSPTLLCTISRQIDRLDLHLGDTVVIEKAGKSSHRWCK